MKSNSNSKSMEETFKDPTKIEDIGLIIVLFFTLISVCLMGFIIFEETKQSNEQPREYEIVTGPPNPVNNSDAVNESRYENLYSNTHNSVVSIYAEIETNRSSQGSGFVYDKNHIVTNQHVVAGTDGDITVQYSNGEWANASIVGSDVYTDIAVLKVESGPKYAEPLYVKKALPAIGEPVAVIGSPDNLEGSLTTGVVSGLNRSMTVSGGFVIPDTIQTDASLNAGNSGGPVFDMQGNVIGISRARQGENIGFAISGRVINTIVPSIIANGKHAHSYVGVRTVPLNPDISKANNISVQNGLLVADTIDGSPASKVLQGSENDTVQYEGERFFSGGDVILEIENTSVNTNEELTSYLIRKTVPGETVSLTILRDGEQTVVTMELGKRPITE